MRQNSNATEKRFPSLYRQDLLDWQRQRRGWSQRETARRAKINQQTIRKVFKGEATNTKVYRVAKALGLDWCQVHNLALPKSEFHLAVRNGTGRVKGQLLGEGCPETKGRQG